MTRILMVCLGNICRSPLAHGILQAKLDANAFYVDSAGTAAYHVGEQPDSRSINVARTHSLDISSQSARQFKVKDFDDFDIIYAMDQSNYSNIIGLARDNDDIQKVRLILEENPSITNKNVPDPYYDGDSGFKNVYNMLEDTCQIIAEQLQL